MATTTLRDRARGAVRDEVLRQAWSLFAEHGFEATTVEMVAEAAGMSRRTFFRYFEGKDELVLARLLASAQDVADALAARPDLEPAWPALRAAFDAPVRAQQDNAAIARALQVMLRDEPGVRGAVQEWHRRLVDLLSPLVAERLPPRGGRGPDVRAPAMTGCAIACLETAQRAWADDTSGVRLTTLLDQAMGAVGDLTTPPPA